MHDLLKTIKIFTKCVNNNNNIIIISDTELPNWDLKVKSKNITTIKSYNDIKNFHLEKIRDSDTIFFFNTGFNYFENFLKIVKPFTKIIIKSNSKIKIYDFDFYSTVHFKNLELIFL